MIIYNPTQMNKMKNRKLDAIALKLLLPATQIYSQFKFPQPISGDEDGLYQLFGFSKFGKI